MDWSALNAAALRGDLDAVERIVETAYPGIPHHPPRYPLNGLTGGGVRRLFDVREAREFAVSRIPGAARVSPGISPRRFLRDHPQILQEHGLVLFACSVGVRSSALALAVQQETSGRVRTANLRGGLFRWARLGLPMVDAFGPARRVNGFDETWERLLPPALRAPLQAG